MLVTVTILVKVNAVLAVVVIITVVALPLTYSFAFVNQWLWARQLGRRLVPTPGLAAPAELGRALDGCRDAMLCLVGAQVPLLELAEDPLEGHGPRRFVAME